MEKKCVDGFLESRKMSVKCIAYVSLGLLALHGIMLLGFWLFSLIK